MDQIRMLPGEHQEEKNYLFQNHPQLTRDVEALKFSFVYSTFRLHFVNMGVTVS